VTPKQHKIVGIRSRGELTNHEPPDRGLLDLGQVRVRPVDHHDGPDHDAGADCGEDAQQDGDGPFVCEVVCDLDLEGVVMVICDHQGRAHVHRYFHDRHDGGWEASIDPIDQLIDSGRESQVQRRDKRG
jgi:hypothetical protein